MAGSVRFSDHQHEWTEHSPVTFGAQSVWTCSGCPVWSSEPPLPIRPLPSFDFYRANTAGTA